jgi:hypothetical protein
MKVNFRIFKIVTISLCCFCAGIGLTVLSVFAINKTDKTGMGGFETANPPLVKESTLETTELSEEVEKSLGNIKYFDIENGKIISEREIG